MRIVVEPSSVEARLLITLSFDLGFPEILPIYSTLFQCIVNALSFALPALSTASNVPEIAKSFPAI